MPALRHARPDPPLRYDVNPSTSRCPVTHAREPHRRKLCARRALTGRRALPRRDRAAARAAVRSRTGARAHPRRGTVAAAARGGAAAAARSARSPTRCARARRQLAAAPDAGAAAAVKSIEARINHDVKAVEYYVREQLAAAGAPAATLELVHFGCTSEDINNLSYARLLQEARALLLPVLELAACASSARSRGVTPALAMLGAHPRPDRQSHHPRQGARQFRRAPAARSSAAGARVAILGKWNGAVGNFNAHVAALPEVDWPAVARAFVSSHGTGV